VTGPVTPNAGPAPDGGATVPGAGPHASAPNSDGQNSGTGANPDSGPDGGTGQQGGTGPGAPANGTVPAAQAAPVGVGVAGNFAVPVPNLGVSPIAPVAAPPAAGSALPAPPATQLAMHIAPLRLDADGVHRLTVNLHPVDLGPVQVVAEIRNGEISVQLSGSTDAGTDALRDALGDLKRELEESGFGNCTLDLRQGSSQQDQARQQSGFAENRRGDASRGNAPATVEPAPAPGTGHTSGTSRLDIRA
jgi:hypothetical protein